MVYAQIKFDGNRSGAFNLGDDLQLIAIKNIYRRMGISDSEIVKIGLSELTSYDGDYAILPISFPLYGYRRDTYITCFSPKIIPVFLGLSIMSENITEDECIYLRRFEPIGCRDYHTVAIMRKHNIMAYLNGCMTLTLPKKKNIECGGGKTYLVDIPERYCRYIPNTIKENAIKTSQILDDCENPEKAMEERLNEYASNAGLVVTTRLHCALPCIAMGIPVVFMKDKYSFRMTALSRFIHPYTYDEFHCIDWNPAVVDFEEIKEKMISLSIKRIKEMGDRYSDIFDISMFYEKDNLREDYYIEHFDNVIDDCLPYFQNHETMRYAIWGITQKADMICTFLENNFPKAKLTVVHDQSKKCCFHGVQSTNFKELLLDKSDFVFVTAATANNIAKKFFSEKGFKNYHISTDGIGE